MTLARRGDALTAGSRGTAERGVFLGRIGSFTHNAG